MNKRQVQKLYKDPCFELLQFTDMTKDEQEYDMLNSLLRNENLSSHRMRNRRKRANAAPCILKPALTGTVLDTYLFAPQILCPGVMI